MFWEIKEFVYSIFRVTVESVVVKIVVVWLVLSMGFDYQDLHCWFLWVIVPLYIIFYNFLDSFMFIPMCMSSLLLNKIFIYLYKKEKEKRRRL